jgi:hypothetical protein
MADDGAMVDTMSVDDNDVGILKGFVVCTAAHW